MTKQQNKNQSEASENKTYSIGSVFIVIVIFVIIISIFTFARNVKANDILKEISACPCRRDTVRRCAL